METNTELLNRIEAHIKGRLAVAESRAASSELYEGKKIAYNSILGVIKSLRADCDALWMRRRLAPAKPPITCRSCLYYERDCPFIRGKFITYPNKVCAAYVCREI